MARWFNVRKAAQVAAFFTREEGGTIDVLKLVKLIYLAERECLERYEFSVLNDSLVSMDHGPVNSKTYNHINGCDFERDAWGEFMTGRANYRVGVARPDLADDQLDELSFAEIGLLHDVWDNFGGMTKYQIRDWTHNHCTEWEDPNGSSLEITYERVFAALGKPPELAEKIRSDRAIHQAFA